MDGKMAMWTCSQCLPPQATQQVGAEPELQGKSADPQDTDQQFPLPGSL